MDPLRGLSPLVVTSPTTRSGTTLLQRLLCSAGNTLVYGEEVGKDLEMQLQILTARRLVYTHSRPRFADNLERFLQGDTNHWLVDLMPPLDDYLAALRQGAFAGLQECQRQAQAAGRTLWGFKYPGWPPHLLRLLSSELPGTRVIYLHRRLADTARSAKAWHDYAEPQMLAFCEQWLANQQAMRERRGDPTVLMLSFESLVQDPAGTLERLRDFLPFEGIDAGLLRDRINNQTHGGGAQHGHNDYIEPAALSAQEQAWVDAAQTAADA
ncbi:sulfotransferase [Arenimonas terrae]|uniref:Sulfotransferase n=1 Tax=Arenimonas terrae TaxID=2546226 RepID=A0A5C4RPK1_9GAMM|nr:sulfotransferase [Arenimonas terrae]TNJ32874.1 sulfotransferase [Arenimonas terrae]